MLFNTNENIQMSHVIVVDRSIIVNGWPIKDNHFIFLGGPLIPIVSCANLQMSWHWLHPKSQMLWHWLHPKSTVPFHFIVDLIGLPTKTFLKIKLVIDIIFTSPCVATLHLFNTCKTIHNIFFLVYLKHMSTIGKSSKLSKHYVDTQAHVCHPCVIPFFFFWCLPFLQPSMHLMNLIKGWLVLKCFLGRFSFFFFFFFHSYYLWQNGKMFSKIFL
jgi:hypothetical protein